MQTALDEVKETPGFFQSPASQASMFGEESM
jgi:hypothetical protein